VPPDPDAVLRNALSGPSRGIEATLAATRAGPFSGFLSYACAHARREDAGGLRFDSDFDQRHTLTAFVRARAGASVVLATTFRYGSGFPFPGFLRETTGGLFLAEERNRVGPPSYSRWDVRGEKRFRWGHVSASFFLEVANVLDHGNERYTQIDSVTMMTGRVRLDRDEMLPSSRSSGPPSSLAGALRSSSTRTPEDRSGAAARVFVDQRPSRRARSD
jgi:hypothetical protein